MEPDKFEKYIKEQLDKREINPSEGSWDKLSRQLPLTGQRKSKRYFWHSVAAVFIGVLIVSSLYFNSEVTPVETPIELVETPQKKEIIPKMEEVLSEKIKGKEQLVIAKKEVNGTKGKIAKKKVFSALENTSAMAASEESDKDDMDSMATERKTDELLDAKIAELVAQVDMLEAKDIPVSDAEVDSLLRVAQQEIFAKKVFGMEGNVDAMALLSEVEGELDQTFREQIFNSLKDGFLKVRTAVADRNN